MCKMNAIQNNTNANELYELLDNQLVCEDIPVWLVGRKLNMSEGTIIRIIGMSYSYCIRTRNGALVVSRC